MVLEFLFGNVSCLVGLFLYYRIVGFEIFLHNHLYIFQEASTEVGFHMAFTKSVVLVIPPHTPSSTLPYSLHDSFLLVSIPFHTT